MTPLDLNYPAKNAFRYRLRSFIKANLAGRLRVLTLETPNLWEVEQVWRPLGVKNEDITVVEEIPARAEAITQNLPGARVITGDVLDFLKDTDQSFECIHLDFYSPFSGHTLECLRTISERGVLRSKAVLAVTVYTRREQEPQKLSYAAILAYDLMRRVFARLMKRVRGEVELSSVINEAFVTDFFDEMGGILDSREELLANAVHYCLTRGPERRSKLIEAMRKDAILPNVMPAVSRIAEELKPLFKGVIDEFCERIGPPYQLIREVAWEETQRICLEMGLHSNIERMIEKAGGHHDLNPRIAQTLGISYIMDQSNVWGVSKRLGYKWSTGSTSLASEIVLADQHGDILGQHPYAISGGMILPNVTGRGEQSFRETCKTLERTSRIIVSYMPLVDYSFVDLTEVNDALQDGVAPAVDSPASRTAAFGGRDAQNAPRESERLTVQAILPQGVRQPDAARDQRGDYAGASTGNGQHAGSDAPLQSLAATSGVGQGAKDDPRPSGQPDPLDVFKDRRLIVLASENFMLPEKAKRAFKRTHQMHKLTVTLQAGDVLVVNHRMAEHGSVSHSVAVARKLGLPILRTTSPSGVLRALDELAATLQKPVAAASSAPAVKPAFMPSEEWSNPKPVAQEDDDMATASNFVELLKLLLNEGVGEWSKDDLRKHVSDHLTSVPQKITSIIDEAEKSGVIKWLDDRKFYSALKIGCSPGTVTMAKNIRRIPVSGHPAEYRNGAHLQDVMIEFDEFLNEFGSPHSPSYYQQVIRLSTMLGYVQRLDESNRVSPIRIKTKVSESEADPMPLKRGKPEDKPVKKPEPKPADVIKLDSFKVSQEPATAHQNGVPKEFVTLVALRGFERKTGFSIPDPQKGVESIKGLIGEPAWGALVEAADQQIKDKLKGDWRKLVDALF